MLLFFFFQAEDGIRDYKVTGVQTCALPISALAGTRVNPYRSDEPRRATDPQRLARSPIQASDGMDFFARKLAGGMGVGRGWGRGRGEMSGVAGSFKKKKKNNKHDDEARHNY